jgi:peroxiredoxin
MTYVFRAFAYLSVLPLSAAADEPARPLAQIQAIQQGVAEAEAAYRAARAKLPDIHQEDAAVARLNKAFLEREDAGFVTALAIARADSKSAAGFAALEWLLMRPRAYQLPAGKQAMELMREHHAANPKVGRAIANLAYAPPEPNEPGHAEALGLIHAVAEKNPDRTARGQAVLGLAFESRREFSRADDRRQPRAERLAQAAEKAFEAVVREYGDCPNLRIRGSRPPSKDLAGEAQTELIELRRLRVGQEAPDIEGEDLHGDRFRLRDQRGKVVLLVFWGAWCIDCMKEVAHEKELVERFKDRPFVLIGVNSDRDKEYALRIIQRKQIPWRSFWLGRDGPGAELARAWNVRFWPTVYVIDHKGQIRHKDLHGKELDEPLEKLIAEAEAAARTSGR